MKFENTLEFAQKLDSNDPLKDYQKLFHLPHVGNHPLIYLTGNSLGLQPKSVRKYIEEELDGWATLGVEGHFHANKRPWFEYHKYSKKALAQLLGANPSEVVSMNNLTSNLHLMMISFYRPTKAKYKIIMEAGAFPSDQYAVESQVKLHGFEYDDAVIEIQPKDGEHTLRTEDIIDIIQSNRNELALVLLGGVQYFTGQRFNFKAIAHAAHEAGAYSGLDLAHAIGNVPLTLHDDAVDFAAWCSYKYLNSGPGGVSGIFVHEKHGKNNDLPRLAGWWGYQEDERFAMTKGFKPMTGADGWQLSNVNVISSAAHLASLEIFEKAGMPTLWKKTELQVGFLHYLLSEIKTSDVEIITPADLSERGCQTSLLIHRNGKNLFDALTEKGVIADWREHHLDKQDKGVIRIAPVPLYNSFKDVYNFCSILVNAIS